MERLLSSDKTIHFLAGFFIAAIMPEPEIGFWVSVACGLGKEVYDFFHQDKHTVDLFDFVATVLGGALGAIVFIIKM